MIIYPIYKTKKKFGLIVEFDGMIRRFYSKKKNRLEALIKFMEKIGSYCTVCEWPKGQKTQMLKNLASKVKIGSINL